MKNIKSLLSLFSLLLFLSCSDDDNVIAPTETLTGNWTLITASGTIAGTTDEFPHGRIVWKFNTNNTVTIVNNNTDESLQSGLPSGTYPYTVSNNSEIVGCEKSIILTGIDYGCLNISDTEMHIDQGIADGINYHFEKLIPFETN
ncbi:MAG: hypothetical protein EOO46_14355 [Flavobacterium sp.]|nr:MAG: hypothetical protein EOO46_14355 [Flavobacterium sp.]